MRICTIKATGRLFEMQSGATPGTLTNNALAAGYALEDVEEREVSPDEFSAILAAQPKSAGEINTEQDVKLRDIDIRSVRALRESLIAGAPTAELLALEAQAVAERAKRR